MIRSLEYHLLGLLNLNSHVLFLSEEIDHDGGVDALDDGLSLLDLALIALVGEGVERVLDDAVRGQGVLLFVKLDLSNVLEEGEKGCGGRLPRSAVRRSRGALLQRS